MNTITGLIPILYAALDTISRELTGFIPAVRIDASASQAAKDQTIRIPISPKSEAEDVTPGQLPADTGNQTIDYKDMTISKSRVVPVRWAGEEQLSLGGNYARILQDQFVQAMRTLVNEIEIDLAAAAYKGASRAYGTAGTTPFASNLEPAAEMKKILDDNGAGLDRSLIINSSAGVKLRSLANLMTAYAAGTDQTLRQGTLLPIVGFDIKESAGIIKHTKGSMTGALCSATEPVGETSIAYDGGTPGASGFIAGDILTIMHGSDEDPSKYVVNTGATGATGNVVIGKPGLLVHRIDNDAITVGADYTPNVAFERNAIVLLARHPKMPEGGDMASDVMEITDPLTGLSFQIALYKLYRRVKFEVGIAWGCAALKSESIGILLG